MLALFLNSKPWDVVCCKYFTRLKNIKEIKDFLSGHTRPQELYLNVIHPK